MHGLIDLHCHPVPGIDDGVRSAAAGVELLSALYSVGFSRVVATPHIRSGLWENRAETIAPARAELETAMADARSRGVQLPELDVAAEHLFDDVVWELFEKKQAMLYPGGRAALVEFTYDNVPSRVELRFWRLAKSGVIPVLAHPERYAALARDSERLQELIGAGARPLLDVMSLLGVYGRAARSAAERMLREGLYFAACSDAHKPADGPVVGEALDELRRAVGEKDFERLLVTAPRELIQGREK